MNKEKETKMRKTLLAIAAAAAQGAEHRSRQPLGTREMKTYIITIAAAEQAYFVLRHCGFL
jgi:hypothetical protein